MFKKLSNQMKVPTSLFFMALVLSLNKTDQTPNVTYILNEYYTIVFQTFLVQSCSEQYLKLKICKIYSNNKQSIKV